MQPSGPLHLGNYLGALRQWVEAQNADAYYCVVDLHALTLEISPEDASLDHTPTSWPPTSPPASTPRSARSSSRVTSPIHAQLNWLLECVATYGELTRMVAFKEKSSAPERATASAS